VARTAPLEVSLEPMSGLTLEVQPFGTGFKAILTDKRGRTFEAVASTRWAAEKQAAKELSKALNKH
jgi:hypothetical protein